MNEPLVETLRRHARWCLTLGPEQLARVAADTAVQQVAANEPVCRKGEEREEGWDIS